MKHITFDLETLGNGPTSPIIQIGATRFTEDEILDTFKVNVDWESLAPYNFKVDYSTIKWWLTRKEAARESVTNVEKHVPIKEALNLFKEWIEKVGELNEFNYWSHASFDSPILTNTCKTIGIDVIIPYYRNRDIRTLEYLSKVGRTQRVGVAHDAGDDSRYQAEYIIKMLQNI